MSDKVFDQRRQLGRISCLIAAVGFVLSMYMLWIGLVKQGSSFCELGGRVSCERVLSSSWGSIFKCPVSLLGAIYFLIVFGVSLMLAGPGTNDQSVAVSFFLSAMIGLVSVFYFVYAEYQIGYICLLCTGVHVCIFVLLFLSWKIYRIVAPGYKWTPSSFVKLVVDMRVTALVAILLVGTPILAIQVFTTPDAVYPPAELEQFGRCLDQKGFVLYTTEGCAYCTQQKEALHGVLPYLKNVQCSETDNSICEKENVTIFPWWKARAASAYSKPVSIGGLQDLHALAHLSKCRLPTRLRK